MRRICILGVLLTSLAASGCGESVPSNPASSQQPQDVAMSSTADLKAKLEEIASTGAGGSAAAGVRPSIEELQKSDPAKGNALMKDLEQLESSTNPEQVKTIAKKMASQL